MFSLLLNIINGILAMFSFFVALFNIFAKYVPAYIQMFLSVAVLAREYVPVELGVVALVCLSTMIVRFVYNAARGSGA